MKKRLDLPTYFTQEQLKDFIEEVPKDKNRVLSKTDLEVFDFQISIEKYIGRSLQKLLYLDAQWRYQHN